ncbi:hypothetical protein ACWEH1_31720, partial [Micromonospora chersina]
MRVVIAGGHGKIAKLLERELAGRGDTAVGLIRNPDHAAALGAARHPARVRSRFLKARYHPHPPPSLAAPGGVTA